MKSLNFSATATKLTSVINAADESGLQELLVNLVYHGLIHGNCPLKQLSALRDSKANGKFKSAVGKYMPVKWVKGKGNVEGHYIFDGGKSLQLRTDFGLTASGITGIEASTIEDVANAVPDIFEKAEKKEQVFNAADSIKRLYDKLLANNCKEEAEAIMNAYNGLILSRAALDSKAA